MDLLKEVQQIKNSFKSSDDKAELTKTAIEKTSEFIHQYNSFLDEDGLYDELYKWESLEFRLNKQLDNIKFRGMVLDIKSAWADIDIVLNFFN